MRLRPDPSAFAQGDKDVARGDKDGVQGDKNRHSERGEESSEAPYSRTTV